MGHQTVDQRAFASTRGAQHQSDTVGEFVVQGAQIFFMVFQTQGQHQTTELLVGQELLPSLRKSIAQVLFV